jgi:hypothetical protein
MLPKRMRQAVFARPCRTFLVLFVVLIFPHPLHNFSKTQKDVFSTNEERDVFSTNEERDRAELRNCTWTNASHTNSRSLPRSAGLPGGMITVSGDVKSKQPSKSPRIKARLKSLHRSWRLEYRSCAARKDGLRMAYLQALHG